MIQLKCGFYIEFFFFICQCFIEKQNTLLSLTKCGFHVNAFSLPDTYYKAVLERTLVYLLSTVYIFVVVCILLL